MSTTRSARRLRSLAVSSLVAFACGSGISSCDQMYDRYVQVSCDRAVKCGLIGASERDRCVSLGGDEKRYYQTLIHAVDASGKLHFDGGHAQRCLDAFAASACGAIVINDPDCSAMVSGTVATGGACVTSQECVSNRCVITAACTGTCQDFVPVGAACTSAIDCDPRSAFCDGAHCTARGDVGAKCSDATQCKDALSCSSGACIAAGGEGQPCRGLVGACDAGLYCEPSSKSVCKRPVAAGGPCTSSLSCAFGLVCTRPTGQTAQTCQPVLDRDAACDPMADACPGDMACAPSTHKCAPPTMGTTAVGDPCQSGGCRAATLALPQYCDATGHCAARLADGEACAPSKGDEPCFSNMCDQATHTCSSGCAL